MERTSRGLLALIVLAYLALGAAYSLSTPIGEAPDEPGHIAYVGFLQAHGRPPRHGEVGPPLDYQVKHPPLYYWLGVVAALGRSVDGLVFVDNPSFGVNLAHQPTPSAFGHGAGEDFPYAPVYAAVRRIRLLGVLLGVLTVIATYAMGRRLAPDRPAWALGGAALVGFWPQFLFMQGMVNNDALANAMGAMALLFAVRVVSASRDQSAMRRRLDLAGLGVFVGLGLLAKLTSIGLLAVAGLAVLCAAWRARQPRRLAEGAVWTGLPFLVATGWWWLYNLRVNGDLLGWGKFQAASVNDRALPLVNELPQYFWIQLTSFWGRFGWTSVPMADAVYGALQIIAALAALGFALWLIRRPWRGSDVDGGALAIIVAAALLTYAAVFRLAFSFDLVVAQGRYLFSALPAFVLLFLVGLLAWLPSRWHAPAIILFAAAQLALAVYALVGCIQPAFRPPPSYSQNDRSAIGAFRSQGGNAVEFGSTVRLDALVLAVDTPGVDSRRRVLHVQPGTTLEASLYWTAMARPRDGYWMFLQAIDSTGRVLDARDVLPAGGRYPTVSWLPGRGYVETLTLTIPADAAPGPAEVIAGLYPDGHPMERVAVTAGSSHRPDAASVPFVIEPETMESSRASPGLGPGESPLAQEIEWRRDSADVSSVFSRLRGLAMAETSDGLTATFAITLVWSGAPRGDGSLAAQGASRPEASSTDRAASAEALTDATVFIHLLDASGAVLATLDGPPFGGRFGPDQWDGQDRLPDRRAIAFEAVQAGRVAQIELGWYRRSSGERFTAQMADDYRGLPDNALRLPVRRTFRR